MRLYNKADTLSDAAKKRKLQREYSAMAKLAQFIQWTDVGREATNNFKEQIKNRKMAEQICATNPDISLEKAQKMVRKSIEVQRKADAARRGRFSRPTPAPRPPRRRQNGRGGNRGARRNLNFRSPGNSRQGTQRRQTQPRARDTSGSGTRRQPSGSGRS